jgi:hypothetical protein
MYKAGSPVSLTLKNTSKLRSSSVTMDWKTLETIKPHINYLLLKSIMVLVNG